MATAANIQITCKISEVPRSKRVDGKVEFLLMENDQVVTVRVKPKQFEQLTEHSFEYWGASVIGKLGPVTERGFELLNPGIQVYEKKPKAGQVPNNPASKVKGKLTDGIHFG